MLNRTGFTIWIQTLYVPLSSSEPEKIILSQNLTFLTWRESLTHRVLRIIETCEEVNLRLS